tara:strand:- start:309 stop:1157 length:849 start_codon:yes stop_codon:yes gene_type:complete
MTRARDISNVITDANLGGTLDVTGNTTVTGSVITSTGFSVGNTAVLGQEIDVSSGNLTIDVAGDITLDAGGGDLDIKRNGNLYGYLSESSNNLLIGNGISDGDVLIRGSDGGTNITAVTFDMSDAGKAIFNSGLAIGGTGSANTLDEYEEGSWTPAFVGSSGGSATYSHQVGRYTKIGNRVCANCYIALSGNSLSGTLSISGLPYASASISQLYHSVSIWINTTTNGNDFDGDFFLEGFLDHNGSSSIFLYSLDGDGGVVSMLAGDITALTDIMINFTYQTN